MIERRSRSTLALLIKKPISMVNSRVMWSRPTDGFTVQVHIKNLSSQYKSSPPPAISENIDTLKAVSSLSYSPVIPHHFFLSRAHINLKSTLRGWQWVSHLLITLTSVRTDRSDALRLGDSACRAEERTWHRGGLQDKSPVIEIWIWSGLIQSYHFRESVCAYLERSLHSSGIDPLVNKYIYKHY